MARRPKRCEYCGQTGHSRPPCPPRLTPGPWQCQRCTEPHAPGSDLCHDHERTMTKFNDERRRGLWADLDGEGED
jgi:hypothetical protein